MQAQGFKVMIITAVNHEVGKQDKTAWLAEHFPKIKPENIHFEHEKYKIHADVFVDDNVENLIAYKAAHPKTLVICMDAPYNVNFEGLRAYNWSDVLRWIESATEVREYV
jgi:5'(3')-deoxyribonucleotidase